MKKGNEEEEIEEREREKANWSTSQMERERENLNEIHYIQKAASPNFSKASWRER